MSLIVEDGSIVTGAESYISVSDADTYFSNRGNAAWAALGTTAKEQALRKATDYMREVYRTRWKGIKATPRQSLDWPRFGVFTDKVVFGRTQEGMSYLVDGNIVPDEVKKACAELAVRSISSALSPDLTKDVLKESVGPLTVEYDKDSPSYTRYRAIDNMLRVYLTGTSVNVSVMRS